MKIYAVKKGRRTGLFHSWPETCKQVDGFPGAEYKAFSKEKDALAYLFTDSSVQTESRQTDEEEPMKAYVDGSYNNETKEFSCGVVFLRDGHISTFNTKFNDAEMAQMRNVAGELKAATFAIQTCLKQETTALDIYYDYEGIEKWCTGEWQAKNKWTKAYKDLYVLACKKMTIRFFKVKAHTGDQYNEMADALAKKALNNGTEELASGFAEFLHEYDNFHEEMISKCGCDIYDAARKIVVVEEFLCCMENNNDERIDNILLAFANDKLSLQSLYDMFTNDENASVNSFEDVMSFFQNVIDQLEGV